MWGGFYLHYHLHIAARIAQMDFISVTIFFVVVLMVLGCFILTKSCIYCKCTHLNSSHNTAHTLTTFWYHKSRTCASIYCVYLDWRANKWFIITMYLNEWRQFRTIHKTNDTYTPIFILQIYCVQVFLVVLVSSPYFFFVGFCY